MKCAMVLLLVVLCGNSALSYSPSCFVELGQFGLMALVSKPEKGNEVCRLFHELTSCDLQDGTFDLSSTTYNINEQLISTDEFYAVCAAKSQWSASVVSIGFLILFTFLFG